MVSTENKSYFLPPSERYCLPGLNEIRFIGDRQSMSLVMGSCISTVFLGWSDTINLAANHIVIANPRKDSIVATKNAEQQINEIINIFAVDLGVPQDRIICLHVLGAGRMGLNSSYNVSGDNIKATYGHLIQKEINLFFNDTGAQIYANYSLNGKILSVLIENIHEKTHVSYHIDIEKLYSIRDKSYEFFPASALEPFNRGFEHMVELSVIPFVTGTKNRS